MRGSALPSPWLPIAVASLSLAAAGSALAPKWRRVCVALVATSLALSIPTCVAAGIAGECLSMAMAALSFSLLGSLAAIRRMIFLAAATPHTSVFSVATALAVAGYSLAAYPVMLLVSLSLALGALAASRRLGSDVATGLVVSLAATGTTLSLYYLASRGLSISSLVVGEAPKSVGAVWPVIGVALLAAAYVPASLHTHLLVSMDEDLAKLGGARVWLHDLALATLFAGVGIATVTSVGFVMQHVLVLVPPAIAANVARGCREGVALSTAISIASACSGALLATSIGIAPAGGVGLALIASYALSELGYRVAGVG